MLPKKSHLKMSMLHYDMKKSHVEIIIVHVDIVICQYKNQVC